MKLFLTPIAIVSYLLLTGCGGAEVELRVIDYTPTLHQFDVVDSYGVDTAKPGDLPLAINPYINNGLFDVSWQVNSLDDYRINIRINDYPSVSSSELIYSEVCGVGRACDQGGGVICQYTSDFTVSCNNSSRIPNIDYLFKSVPQKLYLIMQVCDINSSNCEYQDYPVLME